MIGRTNVASGAGRCVGLIHALYPAGTACTCTNGIMTFSADQSGDFIFTIPSIGNWTVNGFDSGGTAKTITFNITKGTSKLVTLDTLIPPEYRSTYREVEYIQFADTSTTKKQLNVPLVSSLNVGAWDIEFEKFWLNEPANTQWTVLIADGGFRLKHTNQGYLALSESTSELIANKLVVTEMDRTYKIHWSSINEAKCASLTVDNEELTSSASRRTLASNYSLTLGAKAGTTYYAWPGKYRAVKVTKDGILLHQFIPSKRLSDGIPGYFDLMNNEFKQGFNGTNGTVSGIGTLITCGPEIGT